MELGKVDYDYIGIAGESTGSYAYASGYKTVKYSYENYEIKVVLTSEDKFIGVAEVKINRDFMTHKQRMASRSFVDADEYYLE